LEAYCQGCSHSPKLSPPYYVLQVADATEILLKDPQVAGVRDVKLRITTLRRRARIVYLPAYVVDYTFGSRFNQHGERRPERFQAVISGMGELLCCAVLCCAVLCCAVLSFVVAQGCTAPVWDLFADHYILSCAHVQHISAHTCMTPALT